MNEILCMYVVQEGGTALHLAIEIKNLPLLEVLLHHKADANAPNEAV